jgi:hypothetical protein
LVHVPETVNTLIVVGTEAEATLAGTPSRVQIGLEGGSVSVGGASTNLYDPEARKIVARPDESRMIGFVFAMLKPVFV